MAVHIESYRYQEAERLYLGRFSLLDTVLYRWSRKIENSLFEHLGQELFAGVSVAEEMHFSAFYSTLKPPKPIYLFQMAPFPGQCLLVLDNRFVEVCLREGLNASNQARLQKVVQHLVADFDQSWQDMVKVKTRLLKLTTYPFRARILSAYEPCVVVHTHISGAKASCRLTWCFPRTVLEALPHSLEGKALLPSLYAPTQPKPNTTDLVKEMTYHLKVSIGEVSLTALHEALRTNEPVPLQGNPEAVLTVNGEPLLQGVLGEVEGQYALKLTAPYSPGKTKDPTAGSSFQPLAFPKA